MNLTKDQFRNVAKRPWVNLAELYDMIEAAEKANLRTGEYLVKIDWDSKQAKCHENMIGVEMLFTSLDENRWKKDADHACYIPKPKRPRELTHKEALARLKELGESVEVVE